LEELLNGRLKAVRELLNLTQRDISRQIDVGLRSWQDYESGKNVPGSAVLQNLCRLGVNGHWLLAGVGQPLIKSSDEKNCLPIKLVEQDDRTGKIKDKNGALIYVPHWPGVTQESIAYEIKDDSMINVGIGNGTIVIVNLEDNIQSGSIALVDLWGAYTVKYYFKSKTGEVMLRPANKAHVETRFNIQESEDINAIGRVVATIKYERNNY
tara:strand:- start:1709 stop:2338 length:630 start_codon:yes stop_codon:yes gene_type:complete